MTYASGTTLNTAIVVSAGLKGLVTVIRLLRDAGIQKNTRPRACRKKGMDPRNIKDTSLVVFAFGMWERLPSL